MTDIAASDQSAAPSDSDAADADDHGHDDGHSHPSDWAYTKIAVVLAIVTALEVATYFFDIGPALVPSLIFMMIVKFYLVATWFMHLRFDSALFSKMFTAGLILAVGVYLVTLTAFEFWS